MSNVAIAPSLMLHDMQKKMTDEDLVQAGLKVVSLLQKKDFKRIEKDFDYALRYGRSASQAVQEDLNRAIGECGNIDSLEKESITVKVSHFKPDESHLRSLVECYCDVSEGTGILIELILVESGDLYIEDISSYRNNGEHIQSELDNA
ncbi:hypothetical protein ACWPKO_03080 [Coraliomargarita sp. W4R53]